MAAEEIKHKGESTFHHRHHRKPKRDNILYLRQWLNIIFMLGAIAGMGVYFFGDKTTGTIVILISMVFKIVECTLRFIHK